MFIKAVLFLVISSVSCYPRSVVKTLRVYNGGKWGDWSYAQFCPRGQYATGYRMKIEGKLGRGDDTSLNGIQLVCGTRKQMSTGHTATSRTGPWGRWQETYAICHLHGFLTSFKLQVEAPIGKGDDTAANYVSFRYRHFHGRNEVELRPCPRRGFWGDFSRWSSTCDQGSAICGIATKIEGRQGSSGDDTALNDVIFHCCND